MGLLLVAWAASWLLSALSVVLLRPLYSRTQTQHDDRIVHVLQGPVRLALGALVYRGATAPLGLSLGAQNLIGGAVDALLIVAATWLVLRMVDISTLVMRERMLRTRDAS